jgi:hypothetical protein
MRRDDRKAAIAAYKKRKSAVGIYLVRCTRTGATWVGQCETLDTIQNRIWFTLRQGNNPNTSLQDAWRTFGAESFSFEVLEQLAEEEQSYIRNALLKERLAHWRTTLDAELM